MHLLHIQHKGKIVIICRSVIFHRHGPPFLKISCSFLRSASGLARIGISPSHGHPVCRAKYHYHKAVSSHFGFTIPTSAMIFIAPHLSPEIAGWIPRIDHMEHSFLNLLIWQVAHGVSAFLLDRFLRPAGSDIQFSMSSNGICDIYSSHYHFRPLYRHIACTIKAFDVSCV